MSERKPLTLEQLRGMVGKPVLVETERRKEWCILWGYHDPEVIGRAMIFTTKTSAKNQLSFAEYGKSWLAYAYEQPRLDRSAWEPCGACKTEKIIIHVPAFKAMAVCNQHMDHGAFDLTLHLNFCPYCGRPLTDDAWGMLEKRLEGRK